MSYAEETKAKLLAKLQDSCDKGDVSAAVNCLNEASSHQPEGWDRHSGGYAYVGELVEAAKGDDGYAPTLIAATEKWLTGGGVYPNEATRYLPDDLKEQLPGSREMSETARQNAAAIRSSIER